MKNGKVRSIALLTVTWLVIGAVWIVGLNWPRIVTGGAEPSKSAEEAGMQTVIYTLSDTEDDTAPEGTVPEPTAEPAADASVPTGSEAENEPGTEPTGTEADPDLPISEEDAAAGPEVTAAYVLNTHTKKIHLPNCPSVAEMKESNRGYCDDPEEMLAKGYEWCKRCHG